nr:MAG TPA: hypothetical protein [Siphoviridae sp. ctZCl11]
MLCICRLYRAYIVRLLNFMILKKYEIIRKKM